MFSRLCGHCIETSTNVSESISRKQFPQWKDAGIWKHAAFQWWYTWTPGASTLSILSGRCEHTRTLAMYGGPLPFNTTNFIEIHWFSNEILGKIKKSSWNHSLSTSPNLVPNCTQFWIFWFNKFIIRMRHWTSTIERATRLHLTSWWANTTQPATAKSKQRDWKTICQQTSEISINQWSLKLLSRGIEMCLMSLWHFATETQLYNAHIQCACRSQCNGKACSMIALTVALEHALNANKLLRSLIKPHWVIAFEPGCEDHLIDRNHSHAVWATKQWR